MVRGSLVLCLCVRIRLINNKVGMESLSEDLGTRVPCLSIHENLVH